MSILRYIRKLQMLDALIRRKSTGNQQEFSRKACMSRSLLNNYLNEMKELGFPIKYDKGRRTYYYSEDGMLVSKLFQEKVDKSELKKLNGGNLQVEWRNFELLNNYSELESCWLAWNSVSLPANINPSGCCSLIIIH